MRAVGLKALHSRLGEYVRLAASGETVLVTEDGRASYDRRMTAIAGAMGIPLFEAAGF